MQINKIRHNRKTSETVIEYSLLNENSEDEIKVNLKSYDKPLPTFTDALDSLSPFVEQICEFKEGYCKDAEIRGVSFSWTKDVMGAVITALIPISSANSPVVVNTPHLLSESSSDSESSFEPPVLPFVCTTFLKLLILQAEEYIGGVRLKVDNGQEELFPSESKN